MKHKLFLGLALAMVIMLAFTSLVLADDIIPDADIVVPGDNTSVSLGSVAPGAILTPKVSFKLACSGNKHVDNGQTVNLSYTSSGSTIPAGGSLSVDPTSIGAIPSAWPDDGNNCPPTPPAPLPDNGDSTVKITAPTAAGFYTYKIKYAVSLSPAGGNDSASVTGSLDVTYTLTVISNTPPSVTVTGVTNGASYEFGSVPAAVCSVIDVEDGNSSFAATLSVITGPLAAYGLGSQTASCSYTDGGGLSDTDSATYTIVDTHAPNFGLSGPADITAEATRLDGAVVNFTVIAFDEVDPAPVVVCVPASGSTFALGHTKVTCTATDDAGNSAQSDFDVLVKDTTAPELTLPANITTEATGSSGAVVSFTATASDIVDGSVAVSCDPVSGATFAITTTTVNCSATDAHGNLATGSFKVTAEDTTAPLLSLPADQTFEGNATGGYNGAYTGATATDVVDASPAVVCTPTSPNFFALGDTTVNCTATDASGNSSSGSFKVTAEDTTAPLLSLPVDQTFEGNTAGGYSGTYTGATATDVVDASPDVVCTPASPNFFALGDTPVNCTATDDSGNSSSGSFTVTVEDTTSPTITFFSRLPVANVFGWNNGSVTVTWGCSDIVGVVAASVSKTVSSEGSAQSATGTCADTSGNTASDTQSGINIDLTNPTLTWSGGINNGDTFYFLFVPPAPTCTAGDLLSGPNGCGVTGYGTSLGSHTLTATAYDKAGNSYSEGRTYTVKAWTILGFYQPVDMGKLNISKNGSTVPLKFEVFAGTTELTSTSIVQAFVQTESCLNGVVTDDIETYATGSTSLRYDMGGGQFIFNWQTPKKVGACYKVTLTTLDGLSISADFKLK